MKKTFLVIIVFVSLLVVTLGYSVFAEERTADVTGSDFTSITLELTAAPYTMIKDSDGLHTVLMEGFDLGGGIGDPQLPNQVVNIALPPGVLWESVDITVTVLDSEQVDGPFKIAPVEPPATWVDGEKIIAWGEDQPYNEDGENILVYDEDSFFPENYVELITLSQMRKWQFAQLSYTPVRYNPVIGAIEVAKKINIEVSFSTGDLPGDISLSDRVMDQTASIMFENYETAQDWYLGAPYQASVPTTYAIITTNAIESGSTQMANFISHKQNQGYTVLTITEDEYGDLTGDPPNGTAEKIRKWLKNNYISENIEYVLLIGNPDPDDPSTGSDPVGDVPMKMMWPYADPAYEESPTDYYYADLTGDWDLDNDGYYGESGDDVGLGGINFAAEVYVGRIPVYGTSYTTLDKILQKTINYENASPTSIAWRQSALLPMSYSDNTTDGARLAESMMDNYLDSAGYDSWTMYQQGTLCPAANSSYPSDEELFGDTVVRDRWSANDYGIVNWWGHGSQTSTSYGYSECGWGNLFNNAQASFLDDSHPSLVYQCSCNNGWPENSANLGYSILANGAIGTVSASRVSWYYPGEWTPSNLYADNANIGYHWHRELVANDLSAGEALYEVKNSLGSSSSSSGALLMNLYDFNLYGDPAIKITASGPPATDYVYLPMIQKDFQSTGGWMNIKTEDFEGNFPNDWEVNDFGSNIGEYYWGKRNCQIYEGNYSGWAVGGGINGSGLTCGSDYPNDVSSWMEFGPFSLENAIEAELTFAYWLNSEVDFDYIFFGASTDGVNYYGSGNWGYTGGWVLESLDLTDVYTLGDLSGEPEVWIAISFYSDYSIKYPSGVFVDDIVLKSCDSNCSGTTTSTINEGIQSKFMEIEIKKEE